MKSRIDSTARPSFDHVGANWRIPFNGLALAATVLGAVRTFHSTLLQTGARSLTPDAARFAAAVEQYEGGGWKEAYVACSVLADEGDPSAAKLALLMLRHGAPLYGVAFQAEPRRVARWAQVVLRANVQSPVGGLGRGGVQGRGDAQNRGAQGRDAERPTSRRTASPSSITAIA